MIIAVTARKRGKIKVFCNRCACRCADKLTGFRTYGTCSDTVRYGEGGRLKSKFGIDTLHNIRPDSLVFRFLKITFHIIVLVITEPYARCQIRCISNEPEVFTVSCCTGLSGNSDAVISVGRCTCSLCNNILHRTCEQISCCLFNNLLPFRVGIIEDNVTVSVNNLCIKYRTDIFAAVGNSRIGTGHLKVCNTVGQTAESERLDIVVISQCGDAQLFTVFNGQRRCNLFNKKFGCNNVHGPGDGFAYRCQSPVAAVPVVWCITGRCCVRSIHR